MRVSLVYGDDQRLGLSKDGVYADFCGKIAKNHWILGYPSLDKSKFDLFALQRAFAKTFVTQCSARL